MGILGDKGGEWDHGSFLYSFWLDSVVGEFPWIWCLLLNPRRKWFFFYGTFIFFSIFTSHHTLSHFISFFFKILSMPSSLQDLSSPQELNLSRPPVKLLSSNHEITRKLWTISYHNNIDYYLLGLLANFCAKGLYSLSFLASHGCSNILINEEIEANRASELSKITTDMDLILKLNSFAAYHCPFSDYKDEQSV